MADIIIVHGIHTHGGGIDRFGASLEREGYSVRYFEYPKRWAWQLWFPWVMRNDGAALASFMNDGDHIIAHSNGGLVWHNSINAGAKWGRCFIFGAAATSNKFNYTQGCMDEAHIIYNPEDKALFLGALLPFHPFGKLGYRGYTGRKDSRIHNINGLHHAPGKLNHSYYWEPPAKAKW